MSELRVLSLFSGIGAFEKALDNIGTDYELVGFSEIDKYAITSYTAIHNVDEQLNLGDVSKIKESDLPDADLITYGFPCQDVSTGGKMRGIKEGTRSGLLYEAERVIAQVKPKYAIAENVRNLISKRFKDDFNKLLERLDALGYNNYWQSLNAKGFGVPQNRNRVFIVSIRKDVDTGDFKFPVEKIDDELSMMEILDRQVDSKYFFHDREYLYTNKPFAKPTAKLNHVAYFTYPNSDKRHQSNTFYDPHGLLPTIDTAGGGNRQPKIMIDGRFRKITPEECWKAMGFTEEDARIVRELGTSDTQMYKQAGNSIVVPVLEEIFKNLL